MSALAETATTGNHFLDRMPAAGLKMLRPSLARTALPNAHIIHQPGEPIESVVFPAGSIISIVLQMTDGSIAEVGIIGCEGMSGLPIALGQVSSNQRAIVQVPGDAYTLPVGEFNAVIERVPEFKVFLLRFAHASLMVSSQLSACNSLHPINERCAKWLLMAHDRVAGDVVHLTQQFLSQMLGVRRGGVTLAASAMQEAGFISYARGVIRIRDRAGLEAASCECYGTTERNWKATMGYSLRKTPDGA